MLSWLGGALAGSLSLPLQQRVLVRAGGTVTGREGGTAAVAGTSEEVSPEPGFPPGLRRLSPASLELAEAGAGVVLRARRHVLAGSLQSGLAPSSSTGALGGSCCGRWQCPSQGSVRLFLPVVYSCVRYAPHTQDLR